MVATATDIMSSLTELSDSAFGAFCEDMAAMFDADMRCERRHAAMETVQSLREHFKKLVAVHTIQAEGALNGTFSLLFDLGGVFVLSGVIVMLPEPRILEFVRRGSLQDSESLQDAAREAGNLLVGSWDRVFRGGCAGHKHFLKTGTFIGKSWDGAPAPNAASGASGNSGSAGLLPEGETLIVLYDMTIKPYPSFQCAAVFPKAIVEGMGAVQTEDGRPKTEDGVVPRDSSSDLYPPSSETPAPSPVLQETPSAVPDVVAGKAVPRDLRSDAAPSRAPGAEPKTQVLSETGSTSPSRPSEQMSRAPVHVPSVPRLPDQALAELLRLPAAQLMEKDVVWAGPDETVQSVIAKMQQHNVGYVLIGQNGVLEGLVSSSNILGAVSLYLRPMFAQWRRPEDDATLGVKVRWIMSRPVRTVGLDAPLAAIIESLRRCGGRCLPVVDARGAVQGIITVFDILLRLLEAQGNGTWQGRPPQAPALLL
jgi:CBS domain-containing protein